MIVNPTITRDIAGNGLALDDFATDKAYPQIAAAAANRAAQPGLIDGVTANALEMNSDERGVLYELLTTRDGLAEPIVHVYQVVAEPGSIRAWVYHDRQHDRLAYTAGEFEVVLYDLRRGSPTMNRLNVFRVGEGNPCLLCIPPFVIHGVKNCGTKRSAFVNFPTRVFDRSRPDKARLAYGDPRIPYTFDAT
jgi:dTDP-4-dehydrorhamnose 3,5-epimerase